MMNVMRTGWCSYSQKSLLLSVINSKKDYAFTAFQFCVRMQHKGMIRVSQRLDVHEGEIDMGEDNIMLCEGLTEQLKDMIAYAPWACYFLKRDKELTICMVMTLFTLC